MIKDYNLPIKVPSEVQRISSRLKTHGYEAYIVGGCVRDALLGREPKDWDITTSALPHEVKSLFYNTVDTGIQHGTVMVIMEGKGYEVTTYRVDGEYLDSRHPAEVTFTRSLEEDLKRRDFTINAFAWDDGKLVDLFDGLSDLEQGIIRCVGDPDQRFREDALRIMRAVRFSAQLGFSIEAATLEQIRIHAPRLANISMERIRVEWEKTLLSDHPQIVDDFADLGMADYIIPNAGEKCFDRGKEMLYQELLLRSRKNIEIAGNISDFALQVKKSDGSARNTENKQLSSETLPRDHICGRELMPAEEQTRLLMLAAFFSNLEPAEADKAFRALKYDNKTKDAVVRILRYKDSELKPERIRIKEQLCKMGMNTFLAVIEYQRVIAAVKEKGSACGGIKAAVKDPGVVKPDKAKPGMDKSDMAKPEMEKVGMAKPDVAKPVAVEPDKAKPVVDKAATVKPDTARLDAVRELTMEVLRSGEAWDLAGLAVNGSDLIAAGVPAGKKIGEFLEKILQKVIQSPTLNTRETLCSREFLKELGLPEDTLS